MIPDERFPQNVVVHGFGPRYCHDIVMVRGIPSISERPRGETGEQRARVAKVATLVTQYGAMTEPQRATLMTHDRFRYRSRRYSRAVRSALRIAWDDHFLGDVYWWAVPTAAARGGVASPLHAAVLEILGADQLTEEERRILRGGWEGGVAKLDVQGAVDSSPRRRPVAAPGDHEDVG